MTAVHMARSGIRSGTSEPSGRLEDRRLITGNGNYVDDLKLERQAYLGIVRSQYAHAKIKRIDFSKARSHPEFIASLVGEDLIKLGLGPLFQLPARWQDIEGQNIPKGGRPLATVIRYHLAVGKVRYAGEPVAAILVSKKSSVEDLIEEVEVEYEPLPAITTIEQSKSNFVRIYDEWKDNVLLSTETRKGDADKAIRSSSHVVRTRIGIQRQSGAPMEPRSIVVDYDEGKDVFNISASVQSAHRLQTSLAAEFKIPKEKFHIRVMDVGGGFGTKVGQSYPEYAVACLLSKISGMPVKWTSTRTEDFLETAPGRDMYCNVKLACDKDARITALEAQIEADFGVSGTLDNMVSLAIATIPGCYRIPNLSLDGTCYVTNKVGQGPVRGAGRPEGCLFIERAVDILSRKIGMDPVEFRRRNMLLPSDLPYDNGAGRIYDSANFPALLDGVLKGSNYEMLLDWKAKYNRENKTKVAGIGLCLEIDDTGALLTESAKVQLNKDGMMKVYTGSSPHGQGLETTLAQLAADETDIPIDRVTVIYGDTDLVPAGVGTFASRSIVTAGSSVVDAARKLKSQIITNASEILRKDPSALTFEDGWVSSSGGPKLSLREILAENGEISASSDYRLPAVTFATGAHLCAITIDLETGMVKINKYVAMDDCGRIINKQIVEGQIEGGVIQGIGGALLEEMIYDADGQLVTSTFMDYTIPTSLDCPEVYESYQIETPSKISLNGAKGVGESGTVAAYPAVMNALNDALSQIDHNMQLNMVPATPNSVYATISKHSGA